MCAARPSSPRAPWASAAAARSCSRPRTSSAPGRSSCEARWPRSPRSATAARPASSPAAPATTPSRWPTRRGRAACPARCSCPATPRSPRATRRRGSARRSTWSTAPWTTASPGAEARDERGLAFVHPFDDPDVIAGQATLGLELLEDIPRLAKVVVPVGGGGLASGWRSRSRRPARRSRSSGCRSRAARPTRSRWSAASPSRPSALTIADGIAVKRPGEITLPLIPRWLDGVAVVAEDSVAEAMVTLMERAKLVVEGAGAVGVAALLDGRVEPARDGVTAVVLSGRNVDAGLLAAVARRHETESGRRLSCSPASRTGPAASPPCSPASPLRAPTWSRSHTCARDSTSTSARRRSSWCSRPAGATTRRRSWHRSTARATPHESSASALPTSSSLAIPADRACDIRCVDLSVGR